MLRPLPVLLLALLPCCGTAQRPTQTGAGSGPSALARASETGAPPGKIEGEVEVKRRQRMRIWGQVERIRRAAHGTMPPITAVDRGGIGDPMTEIRNQTRFRLTIWFAGKCAQKVDVKPQSNLTVFFCAGDYNLAALVDDSAFLPLVRENQSFEPGVHYRLDFFVEKPPR